MSKEDSRNQATISSNLSWEGIGLHSGLPCSVELKPADEGRGIRFKRIDLDAEKSFPCDIKFVSSTQRSTNLSYGEIEIGTVEHLLAALSAARIDNVEIGVSGPEIPIIDGSAAPFYNALLKHRQQQKAKAKLPWRIDKIHHFIDEATGASFTIIPADHFEYEVILDYGEVPIGSSIASLNESSDFSEFAAARTFVLTSELKDLCNAGLIKGGTLDNAIVISSGENGKQELKEALNLLGRADETDALSSFNEKLDLKYQNELARHKLVDLIGDLALLGNSIRGRIIARKPGHTANAALVKYLKPFYQKALKLRNKPIYDPTAEPLFDTAAIQNHLPHRYPFLMVDKIIELSDTHVVGVKNITFNEQLFQGHFPGNPVFPGVLQMEALAQTGGILALNSVDNPSDWDTYFLKMESVKFKRKVVPGDTLILKMELLSPIRRGIVHMLGTAYVGDNIVSEGELTAQIVNRTLL